MVAVLGLDIGSNSVGSAWVDTEREHIQVGVSVFPAGVDETEDGRGTPLNQDRRSKRSLRRSLARRSARKRQLRKFLVKHRLLPASIEEINAVLASDPWELRRKGLTETLTPFQFGRVLLHLCQRRGALGLNLPDRDEPAGAKEDLEDSTSDKKEKQEPDSEAKVKEAVGRTHEQMKARNAKTFGELIAIVAAERRHEIKGEDGATRLDERGLAKTYSDPVRNRLDSFEFHADRTLIRDEFQHLWGVQQTLGGPLAEMLTVELKKQLDNPVGDLTWRHRGLLFGQRRTYWLVGTLGRCDLEPTDRCVPIADRHASYYRVIETVNNIRIRGPRDTDFRPLNEKERDDVIAKLRTQKNGSVAAVRMALRIDKRSLKKLDAAEREYALNLERDEEREINTDWFYREIVVNGVGVTTWNSWSEEKREGLNRAVLRFDPQLGEDELLRKVGSKLGLDEEASQRLVAAWLSRPKLEKRLGLSRRAVKNLLPIMERRGPEGRFPTEIEARRYFAADKGVRDQTTGRAPDDAQRTRYRLGGVRRNKADRYFQRRHPNLLPPAPTLANPVVRKAIHEVRRHVIAHIHAHNGKRPDRIVIEFARETTKSKKVSDEILYRNRARQKIRRKIQAEIVEPAFGGRFHSLSENQLRAAIDRVILCVQQRQVCAYSLAKLDANDSSPCAYSGRPITLRQAALGVDLEVDHIIPYSRCGDNSLNNRVLCYRASNQDKGQQTPREWWGDSFDTRIAPLRFMDGRKADRDDYFRTRDYSVKWRNLTRKDVATEWKGSQLSDTAYAAREVQTYLQQALWPDEPTHLEGANRRIFVTKGAYTSLLRKDWQLYQRLLPKSGATPRESRQAAAKNRGDHREHAIDAVAIAYTDSERIQELVKHSKLIEEERVRAYAQGQSRSEIRRVPIPPPSPWPSLKAFRRAVLSQLYDSIDPMERDDLPKSISQTLVVSHRATKRKLVGKLHNANPLGCIAGENALFTNHKRMADVRPAHLRKRLPEKMSDAIARIAETLIKQGKESSLPKARKAAKQVVESRAYSPRLIDPPPAKSGLVRDYGLRKYLRNEIERRLKELGIDRDADSFREGDMKLILKQGPICMRPSGVPIKRVALLQTMLDPVVVRRKYFDTATGRFRYDDHPRANRAYQGDSNHHIEIREDAKGQWSGDIVPTFHASRRVRIQKRQAVDRSDCNERGGRFIMSLAEGETVYMCHKETHEPDYFVVFKLDKPQSIHFKRHWDARRDKGEKDEDQVEIPGSAREGIEVSAAQLRDLAPPGERTPVKICVDPLGRMWRVEPAIPPTDDLAKLDSRVVAIARDGLAARHSRTTKKRMELRKGRHPGSWRWMRSRLEREGLSHLAHELSSAIRALSKE